MSGLFWALKCVESQMVHMHNSLRQGVDVLQYMAISILIFGGKSFRISDPSHNHDSLLIITWCAACDITPSRHLGRFQQSNVRTLMWYCWWLKSCTTWDVWNPKNNGIFTISTDAGFQPSTVVGDFNTVQTRFDRVPKKFKMTWSKTLTWHLQG